LRQHPPWVLRDPNLPTDRPTSETFPSVCSDCCARYASKLRRWGAEQALRDAQAKLAALDAEEGI
jgi:hypothetical protein